MPCRAGRGASPNRCRLILQPPSFRVACLRIGYNPVLRHILRMDTASSCVHAGNDARIDTSIHSHYPTERARRCLQDGAGALLAPCGLAGCPDRLAGSAGVHGGRRLPPRPGFGRIVSPFPASWSLAIPISCVAWSPVGFRASEAWLGSRPRLPGTRTKRTLHSMHGSTPPHRVRGCS